MDLRFRDSFEARRAESFFEFFCRRSVAGASHRERQHSSYQMDGVVTIPAFYLNTTIFIGPGL
jgi:hypothetical protein